MAVLGWILLGLLGLVLAAVLVLVATPLHLDIAAEIGAAQRVTLEARSLWGLTPRLRLVDTDRPQSKASDRPRPRRDPSHGKRSKRGGRAPRITRARAMRLARGAPRLVGDEIARIHIDRLDIDARFGTGDPAETGKLYGWLMALLYGLPPRRLSFALQPDFTRACLEGRAEAALHLTPIALVGPVLRLGWDVFVRPA